MVSSSSGTLKYLSKLTTADLSPVTASLTILPAVDLISGN